MNSIKIKVYSYSEFDAYLTVPDFDSIIGDSAKTNNRHFISGYGRVIKRDAMVDCFPIDSLVAFCGYTSCDRVDEVTTNTNNVTIINTKLSEELSISGYIAFIINIIKKGNIGLGENVCIQLANHEAMLLTERVLNAVGCNVQDDEADVTITDDGGASISVNRQRWSRQVGVPGDLADIGDYSVQGKQIPYHYITSYVSKNLAAAINILPNIDLKDLKDDLMITQCSDDRVFNDCKVITPHFEWNPVNLVKNHYDKRIDSAFLSIAFQVEKVDEYEIILKEIFSYVIGENLEYSKNVGQGFIFLSAKTKTGSIVNGSITQSSNNQYEIEYHADGESLVLGNSINMLYQENGVKQCQFAELI